MIDREMRAEGGMFQYRKRYELHAIAVEARGRSVYGKFQYRKRYELHAISKMQTQSFSRLLFQYRKRYELHAIKMAQMENRNILGFNTASGMNCMQSSCFSENSTTAPVSIPQAV